MFNTIGQPTQDITGIFGLKLCDEHIEEIKPEEFTNLKEVVLQLIGSSTADTPDLESVYFSKVSLDSNEYELFINPPKIASEPFRPKNMATPSAPFPRLLPLRNLN
jgi:hypothetical protein